jgi:signal transduction histidine kinase
MLTKNQDFENSRSQQRILAELEGLVTRIFAIRIVGVLVLGTIAILSLVTSHVRIEITGFVLAVVIAVFIHFIRRQKTWSLEELTYQGLQRLFFGAVALQTALIAITGGIHSPFLVVYVPAMAVSALVSGRPRVVVGPAILVVLAISTFLAVDLWLPVQLPTLPVPVQKPLLALTVSVAVILGVNLSLSIRRAIERSVVSEEKALARSIVILHARNSELKDLSSALAHELKNPLAAIQGLTMNQARNAPPGSREAERLGVVVDEVLRMSKILNDFLTFARPFGDIEPAPTDLNLMLDDLVALYEDHAASLKIQLRKSSHEPVIVECDRRQIQHVLVNLMQNALEASSAGQTITLSVSDDQDFARVRIRDQGAGIAEEIATRVFEAGVSTRAKGTGIGLSIAQGIIDAHQGSIELTNQPGGGCEATVLLSTKMGDLN